MDETDRDDGAYRRRLFLKMTGVTLGAVAGPLAGGASAATDGYGMQGYGQDGYGDAT